MPARTNRRADPLSAASSGDRGEVLTCCRAHLLKLVQDVGPRLFEKWPPLFPHLDGIGEGNDADVVRHFTDYLYWRLFTAHRLKVKTKCLGQLQLRYSQVVLCSNE